MPWSGDEETGENEVLNFPGDATVHRKLNFLGRCLPAGDRQNHKNQNQLNHAVLPSPARAKLFARNAQF